MVIDVGRGTRQGWILALLLGFLLLGDELFVMLALFVDEFLETLFGDVLAIVFVGADDISLDDSMVVEAGISSFWCWRWYSLCCC